MLISSNGKSHKVFILKLPTFPSQIAIKGKLEQLMVIDMWKI